LEARYIRTISILYGLVFVSDHRRFFSKKSEGLVVWKNWAAWVRAGCPDEPVRKVAARVVLIATPRGSQSQRSKITIGHSSMSTDGGGITFDLIRLIVRAVPDRLRGKTRLASLALRPFLDGKIARIPDKFGNVLHLPGIGEPISLSLFASGVYEPNTLGAILHYLRPSGVFVDVGANVGALALPVAVRRPGSSIICIEADPEIVSLLRRNVTENGRSNISVVHCLAGPIDDPQASFYRSPATHFGMGSIGPQFWASPTQLPQRPLDEVLDELAIPNVDVVKLDIEGAEFGALQGLGKRLTSLRPPVIVFEFADWAETRIAGQAAGSAQEFLLSLGYSLFRLARGGKAGERLVRPITIGFDMIVALPSVRT
jgi:FkbM family methyltransferase